MKLYTIGFAGKTETEFYQILRMAGVKCIWDIRLWRDSAPEYFAWARGSALAARCKHNYKWVLELAPTEELLSRVKGRDKKTKSEKDSALSVALGAMPELLRARCVENLWTADELDKVCLMCSEKSVDNCHRKIVAEYLAAHFPDTEIIHL
jgi:uncharacterized protein (DUF488 family)